MTSHASTVRTQGLELLRITLHFRLPSQACSLNYATQDRNGMGKWATQRGPEVALKYWALKPEATMRDVVLQVEPSCIMCCSAI